LIPFHLVNVVTFIRADARAASQRCKLKPSLLLLRLLLLLMTTTTTTTMTSRGVSIYE
jgi:hypothetical protein